MIDAIDNPYSLDLRFSSGTPRRELAGPELSILYERQAAWANSLAKVWGMAPVLPLLKRWKKCVRYARETRARSCRSWDPAHAESIETALRWATCIDLSVRSAVESPYAVALIPALPMPGTTTQEETVREFLIQQLRFTPELFELGWQRRCLQELKNLPLLAAAIMASWVTAHRPELARAVEIVTTERFGPAPEGYPICLRCLGIHKNAECPPTGASWESDPEHPGDARRCYTLCSRCFDFHLDDKCRARTKSRTRAAER